MYIIADNTMSINKINGIIPIKCSLKYDTIIVYSTNIKNNKYISNGNIIKNMSNSIWSLRCENEDEIKV